MRLSILACVLLPLLGGCALMQEFLGVSVEALPPLLDAASTVLPAPWNTVAEWAAILFGGSKGMQAGVAGLDMVKGSGPNQWLTGSQSHT